MSEDMILVEYDPFNLESRVCVIKDGSRDYSHVESDINELVGKIVALAYSTGVYEIKTHAPYAVSSEIRRLAQEVEMTEYSENKLNIEGI